MKIPRMSRRQFFKASAFGAGALAMPTLGLASVSIAPSREAQAAAEQPAGPAIPQPTFTPLAANTAFGALTDIAMGWDGTLWGIDAQGAPHIYDAINDMWQPHGAGVDAVASDNQVLYLFRGSQVVTFDLTTRQASAPASIAATWPNLPDTFKLGVDGASYDLVTKKLILFEGGRYAPADGSAPPKKLTDLANWPANDQNFGAGVINGVFSALTSAGATETYLLRGAQALRVDLATAAVTDVPRPFTEYYDYATYLPTDFRINGLDAGVAVLSPAPAAFTNYMYRGPGLVTWSRGSTYPQAAQYVASAHPNWPAAWHPALLQAPGGRDGNLWSVVRAAGYAAGAGQVIQHNGQTWTPFPSTTAASVSAGQDGTVIHVQPNTGSMWQWNGSGWSPVGPAVPAQLQQISLGGANDAWVRDTANNVYRFDPVANTFALSTIVGQATHIATTGDGTLWHARDNDANAYRLLAGQNLLQPPIPVQRGIVTSVQKVTGTGFGTGYCLAQAGADITLYRFDSPYVFKSQYGFSPIPGSTLVEALGAIYFTNSLDFDGDNAPVVALDAHTGAVRSQSASVPNPQPGKGYTQPVFDPVNALIYVGVTQPYDPDVGNYGPGQLIALDATDLSNVVWSYDTAGYISGGLTVMDGSLWAGDRYGNLYQFDTAASKASPSQAAPTNQWSLPLELVGPQGSDVWNVSQAVALNDAIVMVAWRLSQAPPFLPFIYLIQVDPAAAPPSLRGNVIRYSDMDQGQLYALSLASPPIVVNAADGSVSLAVNAIDSVLMAGSDLQTVQSSFSMPDGTYVFGGLTLDEQANQLWFGDSSATLYCLDAQFRAQNYTPFSVADSSVSGPMLCTPVLYRDASGGKTLFTGLLQTASAGYLYGFDPDNGNLVSLPTGDTQILSLSSNIANGVLYAGGVTADPNATSSLSQLFGLRVDDLVQGERDFIIESQLLQDPDETATNGSADIDDPIPPSVARYQTHISVVDDQKTPRTNEALKIWADVDGTVITIEGQQYTIGPGDDQFAQIQTGPGGSVVVVSDADDVTASPLRAWASFMDPYERIVIYPDHEWHGRVAATNNDPNASVTQPDPTRPNLSAAHNYSGAQLFTADEKTDKYPDAMASAIAQMRAGLNLGASSAATLAGSLKTLHASNPASAYVAYSDLGGMHYAPNNALAQRTATAAMPFGLMWETDDAGNSAYTALSHSDAADEIDTISGTPWNPDDSSLSAARAGDVTGPAGALRVHSWGSFWHHVRHAVEKAGAKIKKVVVSVADRIKAAIAYVADGVTTFFKAVIEVVEDVVEHIGAFFLQLGKLIEDVIEALSLLFHFGEIMKTHRWMRDQFDALLASVVDAMQNQVKPGLDGWFGQGEQAILEVFSTIRQKLGIDDSTQVNDLSNAQSTAHTAFKAGNGSAGPGSGGNSHAVQCAHSTHKLKSGLPSAAITLPGVAGALPAAAQSDVDSLLSFMSEFIDSLENNAALKEAFSSLTTAINNLTQPSSAGDFFESALNTLLSIIESLIVGALAVAEALADGLIALMTTVISLVTTLFKTTIDIPFFSWLYKLLFGEDLTILNLVTLVAAIPVTVLYRIGSGNYPSQDGFIGVLAARGARPTSGISDAALARMQGTIGALFAYALGWSRTFVDALGKIWFLPGSVCVLGFGMLYSLTYSPYWIPSKIPTTSPTDWANWGLGLLLAALGTFGLWQPTDAATALIYRRVATALRVTLAVTRWALFITTFAQGNNFQVKADLAFARNMVLQVPPFWNWLKLFQRPVLDLILAAIDLLSAYITMALDLTVAWLPGDARPLPRRLFFPFVPVASAAHPR